MTRIYLLKSRKKVLEKEISDRDEAQNLHLIYFEKKL